MSVSPGVVVPKFRKYAYVVVCLLGVFWVFYVAYRIHAVVANDPPVVVSRSTDWGSFPNIWLCQQSHGAESPPEVKPLDFSCTTAGGNFTTGCDVPFRSDVWSDERLPLYIGDNCAVFDTSTIEVEGRGTLQLNIEVKAQMGSDAFGSMAVIVVSTPDTKGTDTWVGEIGGFVRASSRWPVQLCSLEKSYVGEASMFSESLHARYKCPSMGSSAAWPHEEEILFVMQVPRAHVTVIKKVGLDRAIFRELSNVGGTISWVTLLFGLCFVVRQKEYTRLTLVGHQRDDFIQEASTDSESEKDVLQEDA